MRKSYKLFGDIRIKTMTEIGWAKRHKRHAIEKFQVRDGEVNLGANYCKNCGEMYIKYFN